MGDNVVWQVDDLNDYAYFVRPFLERAIRDGHRCVYLRFAPHPPVVDRIPGLEIAEVDPSPGFDFFSGEVHRILEKRGSDIFYVFDNLSALVVEWATDELLANFFQVTCPYLFELDTVTYFALTRGRHAHSAVARVRDTTQLLIDVYHVKNELYVHPLKVWARYSPQMFLPHRVAGASWQPVFQSADAAAVAATARKQPLRVMASSIAPWETVYQKLIEYRWTDPAAIEASPELTALKQELSRMVIGSHPEFNRLADRYLTLQDLFSIRDRLIGSGRIGGKASGMLVARRVLLEHKGKRDFSEVLENHDSFYIGSDVFFTFLVNNDLFRLRLELSRDPRLSPEEFADVESRFLAGKFPPEIMEQFRDLLDYFGQAPIIVRSSSLLEDSFGNAFAGKYRSEFCANQGSPEDRLEAFLSAVKLVYASALNADALSYRQKRGLGASDEQMAILVQRVSGMPYKNFFFPSLAGVAFSRNLYSWTDRIDPRKGIIRLVFGLGTRAVNRVGDDYPRMLAVSHPEIRPEVGTRIAKYSQRDVDVLDLTVNELVTRPLAEVLTDGEYPNLQLLVSEMRDGSVTDPISRFVQASPKDFILTFNNLVKRTPFTELLGEMLVCLEEAYGHPVDTEFTASVDAGGRVRINLLQCRPLWVPGATGPITVPEEIPLERTLFRSNKVVSGGIVRGIRYILYIDPQIYASIGTMEIKKSLGRVVGLVNARTRMGAGKVLMMGPGRWGSSNIDLGVNVSYADIDNTAVLVEIAREEAGHVPEVSYGTHFFQDLVEEQIIYLPLYPDDPKAEFHNRFFESSRNVLTDLVPDAEKFKDFVHVIDVPSAANGAHAHVVADPQSYRAICYLE